MSSTMKPPSTVNFNNYMEDNKKPFVDWISIMFINIQAVFGLGRLPIRKDTRPALTITIAIYAVFINITRSYYFYLSDPKIIMNIILNLLFLVHFILNYVLSKNIQTYYVILTEFDQEAGCRPKLEYVKKLVHTIFVIVTHLTCAAYFHIQFKMDLILAMTPVQVINMLELHFYGHLQDLITARLNFLSHEIESSQSNINLEKKNKSDMFLYFSKTPVTHTNCDMTRMMHMYQIVIKAHDAFIDSVKWQMLSIIISLFLSTFTFTYQVSLDIISGSYVFASTATGCVLTFTLMASLYVPCFSSNGRLDALRRLKELLAFKILDGNTDKSSRAAARVLLELTETRSLSFSLLRMFEVDISLPYNFIGLLITYLVILLQFNKVLNP